MPRRTNISPSASHFALFTHSVTHALDSVPTNHTYRECNMRYYLLFEYKTSFVWGHLLVTWRPHITFHFYFHFLFGVNLFLLIRSNLISILFILCVVDFKNLSPYRLVRYKRTHTDVCGSESECHVCVNMCVSRFFFLFLSSECFGHHWNKLPSNWIELISMQKMLFTRVEMDRSSLPEEKLIQSSK